MSNPAPGPWPGITATLEAVMAALPAPGGRMVAAIPCQPLPPFGTGTRLRVTVPGDSTAELLLAQPGTWVHLARGQEAPEGTARFCDQLLAAHTQAVTGRALEAARLAALTAAPVTAPGENGTAVLALHHPAGTALFIHDADRTWRMTAGLAGPVTAAPLDPPGPAGFVIRDAATISLLTRNHVSALDRVQYDQARGAVRTRTWHPPASGPGRRTGNTRS
jgi:hypothetical protein